jgi:GAF domain-containing protein
MIAAVLALTGYLTRQQRQAVRLRQRLHDTLLQHDGEQRRNQERLGGMLEVTRALAAEVDPQAIFDRIAGACRKTFTCDQVSLMLLNRESGFLEVRAADGHDKVEEVKGRKIRVGEGIAGWVAQNRKPILLGKSLQIRSRFGVEYDSAPLTAAMIAPIIVRDELVGVINVSSRKPDSAYTDDDLQALLVFAEQAGVALRHTEQTTWLRQTLARLDDLAAAGARGGNGDAARASARREPSDDIAA